MIDIFLDKLDSLYKKSPNLFGWFFLVFSIGAIGLIFLVIPALIEMNSFNKFSDIDANIIDALFTDLRVNSCK